MRPNNTTVSGLELLGGRRLEGGAGRDRRGVQTMGAIPPINGVVVPRANARGFRLGGRRSVADLPQKPNSAICAQSDDRGLSWTIPPMIFPAPNRVFGFRFPENDFRFWFPENDFGFFKNDFPVRQPGFDVFSVATATTLRRTTEQTRTTPTTWRLRLSWLLPTVCRGVPHRQATDVVEAGTPDHASGVGLELADDRRQRTKTSGARNTEASAWLPVTVGEGGAVSKRHAPETADPAGVEPFTFTPPVPRTPLSGLFV